MLTPRSIGRGVEQRRMSRLSLPNKIFLEGVLGMGGGYVLNFSNSSFTNFFGDLNIDVYDEEKYSATIDAVHAPPDAVMSPVIRKGKIPGRMSLVQRCRRVKR